MFIAVPINFYCLEIIETSTIEFPNIISLANKWVGKSTTMSVMYYLPDVIK